MRFLALPSLILLTMAVSGCATVSQSECESGDWRSVGLKAGAAGLGEERYSEDLQACQKHGIRVDRDQWMEGHARGLERFCTVRNGYTKGTSRAHYLGTCPQPADSEFRRGYDLGVMLADARDRLAEMSHHIEELQNRIAPKEHEEGRPQSESLSEAEKIQMGIELGALIVRREHAEDEVRLLERRASEL